MVHQRAQDGQQLAFTKDGKVVPMHIVGLIPSMIFDTEPAGVLGTSNDQQKGASDAA